MSAERPEAPRAPLLKLPPGQEWRRRLPRAWTPFFARFGRLTPVQEAVIPHVLAGTNVIVAAATASGKTEAVVAPLAERYVAQGWGGLALLYVVPTRALANDALVRVQGPLEEMGIRTVLKHGDSPSLPGTPNCLITTPESLDSLVCRRPELFASLRAVLLDEIHLLDGTSRGDQLRVLLRRLPALARRDVEREFETHLLAATLADAADVAARYAAGVQVVEVPGRRDIRAHYFRSYEDLLGLARARRWRKLLAFCNKREAVETTAAELAVLWRPYPVVAHHGSLERAARVEAETVMREAPAAVCVATSTLEVGIDIGDIDAVVLVDPPWSVASLLQRIGRGNRRAAHTTVAVRAESRLLQ